MLWLAGIMGLLAVGSVGIMDMETETDDDSATDEAEATTQATEQVSADADPTVLQNTADAAGNPPTNSDDILHGSDSADTLAGDAGNDLLHGKDDSDVLGGEAGDDTLFGHNGNDTLHGGEGDDSLQGSDGDDVVEGADGNDAVHGGLGDDTVSGGAGSDTLFGGHGDDVVIGLIDDPDTDAVDDSDFLNGGDGNDVIIAGNDDVVTPGNGEDTIVGGSWITEGNAIDIIDFDTEDDNLLLIYEDDAEIPNVSLQLDPDDSHITHVLMDGVAVANVLNGSDISIEDIAIMPLSLAQSSGMAPL